MLNNKLISNNKLSHNSMNKQTSNKWDDPEDIIYAKKNIKVIEGAIKNKMANEQSDWC